MEVELQEAAGATIEPPGSAWQAFRHRNFTLFFWGQLISMIGTWSQVLALSWLVWQLTHSPMWLGLIGFFIQIPVLLFGLPGGAAADRFDRRRSLVFMQVLCMLQALLLAVLTMTHVVQLWHVVVLSVALGAVYAFEFPIRQAFVMDLVGRRDLLNANALVSAMFHVTRILGPAAAGIIVAWKGEGVCFLFNALTFIALIIVLFLMDRSQIHQGKHAAEALGRSIMAGLRYVSAIPVARLALILVAALAGIGMQFTTLMPIFADRVYGGGAVQLGWLMAASGLGSLLGALWLARRTHAGQLLTLSAVAGTIFSVALVGFGIVPRMSAGLPILVILGLCLTLAFSSTNTLLQHRTPDHLRGRMMSLYMMMFVGVAPFGSILAGAAAKAFGAQITIAATGVICFLAAGWVLAKARRVDV